MLPGIEINKSYCLERFPRASYAVYVPIDTPIYVSACLRDFTLAFTHTTHQLQLVQSPASRLRLYLTFFLARDYLMSSLPLFSTNNIASFLVLLIRAGTSFIFFSSLVTTILPLSHNRSIRGPPPARLPANAAASLASVSLQRIWLQFLYLTSLSLDHPYLHGTSSPYFYVHAYRIHL
jgi:hypothetical protein